MKGVEVNLDFLNYGIMLEETVGRKSHFFPFPHYLCIAGRDHTRRKLKTFL